MELGEFVDRRQWAAQSVGGSDGDVHADGRVDPVDGCDHSNAEVPYFGTTPTYEFTVPTGTTINPTGGGQTPPVPLPAAAWSGMALLSMLGVGKKIRRKFSR